MKLQTLQLKLAELKITPSHSRLRMSNDNAYVESLFRTLKYVRQWPSSDFKTLDEARKWVDKFISWYSIGYVTPEQSTQVKTARYAKLAAERGGLAEPGAGKADLTSES